ncbi:MAG: DUF2191 domain-containing protein [Verrucomicrobiota bacterium]
MRTTITIQDSLLERAKEEALRKKCKLSDVVNDALRYRLAESSGAVVEEAPLLTYGSGGLRPGVDLADSGSLQDIMNEPR